MLRRVLLGFCAISAIGLSGQANAQDFQLGSDNLSQIVGPLFINPGVTPVEGGPLYTNNVETGFRYTPGLSQNNPNTGSVADIAFDDIPISNALLGGATQINVTRVTYGIRRLASAPAVTITPYFSTLTTTVVAPNSELDAPGTAFGVPANLAANGAASVTQQVVFGDGTNTLFTVNLNNTIIPGFSTFALGMSLVDASGLNGWRITNGPAANANIFWVYDSESQLLPTGTPPSQNITEAGFAFSQTNPPNPAAAFYVIVEGSAVPEPATLSLGAIGLIGLAMRRRS